ncbi:unnamed protein product, partial [Rotaria magnacalcarata]
IIKNRTLTNKQRRDAIDKSNSTNLKLIQTTSSDESYKINNKRSDDYFDEQESYEHLCRQNGTRLHPTYQSKLFCRYRHNNHPYLILQPVKEEQLLHQPAILFYHDIISDSDIEKIKSLALPKLQRAVVRDFTTDTFQPVDYRI